MVDMIQVFFCFCYMFRACFIKLKIHKTIQKWSKAEVSEEELAAGGKEAAEADGDKKEDGVPAIKSDEDEDDGSEIDGYSQSCSLTTDFCVVVFFVVLGENALRSDHQHVKTSYSELL